MEQPLIFDLLAACKREKERVRRREREAGKRPRGENLIPKAGAMEGKQPQPPLRHFRAGEKRAHFAGKTNPAAAQVHWPEDTAPSPSYWSTSIVAFFLWPAQTSNWIAGRRGVGLPFKTNQDHFELNSAPP